MSQCDHGISTTRETTVSATLTEIFELLLSIDPLPKIFTAYGILPGVIGYSDQCGVPGQPDSQRKVHLSDGTFVHELITASIRPRFLAFRIVKPSSSLDKFLSEGYGEWSLTDLGAGVRVKWTYTFLPTNAFTRLLIKFLILPSWHRFMEIALANLQRHFGIPE